MSSNVDQTSSKGIRESIWAKLRKESGARLREERMRLKLSQEAFAEKVGVHRRTQLNYEAGEREPDAAYYEAAASLGIDDHGSGASGSLSARRGAPVFDAQPGHAFEFTHVVGH